MSACNYLQPKLSRRCYAKYNMLGETEKSSNVCKTASLSEMGHEQRAATSSAVTDQRRKNFFVRKSSFVNGTNYQAAANPRLSHTTYAEPACTCCQSLHPPSPFVITQPKSWYSFYCPKEGRRRSRPSWLVTYRDGLRTDRRSPILVLTGSDVAQLRWLRPSVTAKRNRQQNAMLLLLVDRSGIEQHLACKDLAPAGN